MLRTLGTHVVSEKGIDVTVWRVTVRLTSPAIGECLIGRAMRWLWAQLVEKT